MKRTYDWNGHTLPISMPDCSDETVAIGIRMLHRNDTGHEAVCLAARDRIMALVKEKQQLLDTLRQWQHSEETHDSTELHNAKANRDLLLAIENAKKP